MRLETQIRLHRRGLACVLAFLSSLFVLPAALYAADAPLVSLSWNANPESNISGYKLHFGTQSGVYSTVLDVGNSTQVQLPLMQMGGTYYMAVSAYNSAGFESPRSAEFLVTAATPPEAVGMSFTMGSGTTAGQGNLKWKYPKASQAAVDRFAVYSSEDLVNWTEAARLATSAASSSDSQYLYFDYPYQTTTRPKMFFKVAPRNAFGETN
jgi:hypothetical protein